MKTPYEMPKPESRLSRSTVGREPGPGSRSRTNRLFSLLGAVPGVRDFGHLMTRHLWIWPILAALVVGGVGWFVHHSVEKAMRERRTEELTTILNADIKALEIWMREQTVDAELLAADENVIHHVQELLKTEEQGENDHALVLTPTQKKLRAYLDPRLTICDNNGYFVVSPNGVVVGSDLDDAVGKPLTGIRKEFFNHILKGQASVSRPFRSPLLLKDQNGELKSDLPTMFAAAPIRDRTGKPIAALGIRIQPEGEFTQILQTAAGGNSGETYAFDRNGLMLSNSRFDKELKAVGLLAERPEVSSVLTLELRDPGVNMPKGERPSVKRSEQPLTHMARNAVEGGEGCDVDGYRDYRGVPVIGAWRWLDEYDFGVATEVDVEESFAPLYILRRALWTLTALLAFSSIGIWIGTTVVARQQRALKRAASEVRRLGQYTLEEKLGEGGMGAVYKARHAMLRRPTAVKLMNLQTDAVSAARFEREVQLTAALSHPNTVAIYDYGRTPEGVFYYAMEYLEGMNLDQLVERTGPISEARVVHILRQLCGSLAEAHAEGLVHRDIKPANIFLTCRGGMHDFVKVLDFGLAKPLNTAALANLTAPESVTGTPLYISPEAVQQPDRVDVRADVYAIGAVAYFLLTGSPVFRSPSIVEICLQHVREAPEPPSKRLGQSLHAELEALVLRCLEKSPDDRPSDASVVLRELKQCRLETDWSEVEAQTWWQVTGKQTKVRANVHETATNDAPECDNRKTVEFFHDGERSEGNAAPRITSPLERWTPCLQDFSKR